MSNNLAVQSFEADTNCVPSLLNCKSLMDAE